MITEKRRCSQAFTYPLFCVTCTRLIIFCPDSMQCIFVTNNNSSENIKIQQISRNSIKICKSEKMHIKVCIDGQESKQKINQSIWVINIFNANSTIEEVMK